MIIKGTCSSCVIGTPAACRRTARTRVQINLFGVVLTAARQTGTCVHIGGTARGYQDFGEKLTARQPSSGPVGPHIYTSPCPG